MADSNPKFVLYIRQFLKNPLLARKQASIELIHPELAGVDKASVKSKLAKLMKTKEECINIYGLKTKFGGGRSSGFALIYDSVDAKKRYDSKCSLKRVSSSFLSRQLGSRKYGTTCDVHTSSARLPFPVFAFKTNKRALFNILICIGPQSSQVGGAQKARPQG